MRYAIRTAGLSNSHEIISYLRSMDYNTQGNVGNASEGCYYTFQDNKRIDCVSGQDRVHPEAQICTLEEFKNLILCELLIYEIY